MLNRIKTSKRSEGFTIIEVMIVLAIAALILLIVLLAVPALQRTSRNTQRKNDASAIASLLSTSLSDNNGALPEGYGDAGTSTGGKLVTCTQGGTTSGAITTDCTTNDTLDSAKIGYYTPSVIYINNTATPSSQPSVSAVATGSETTTGVSSASMLIVPNTSCPDSVSNSGTQLNYSARDAAILYVVEGGGQYGNLQCTDS